MASRLLLQRSLVATRVVTRAGSSGASPPLPPFARLPAPTQPLVENHDIIFDDGVAPELAIDFDSQHISSGEAVASLLGMFGVLASFYQLVKWTNPVEQNPAVNRTFNMVVEGPKTGKAFFDKV